jgi:hypothetical protein
MSSDVEASKFWEVYEFLKEMFPYDDHETLVKKTQKYLDNKRSRE